MARFAQILNRIRRQPISFPIVRQRPSLSPFVFLRRRGGGDLPEPLNDARCTFYFKGRNAVWHAVKALKLTPQETILVPSYHCGADLDAIIKTGAKVEFYRVDRSATIDLEHLQRSINANTRALFIIHYFGFADPRLTEVRAMCRAHNIRLVEDCAHAMYSKSNGESLGTLGDVSVFSLFKSLPVPHGGAVRVNDPSLTVERPGTEPPAAEGFDMVHWSMEAHLRAKLGILGQAVNKITRLIRRFGGEPLHFAAKRFEKQAPCSATTTPPPPEGCNPHVTFDLATKDWSPSRLTALIARRLDHLRVKKRRRENFQVLAGMLRGSEHLEFLHSELPEGICPLGLPIIVNDAVGLHSFLQEHRVSSDLFWKTRHDKSPDDAFPDTAFLTTHVVMLPIHQEVGEKALRQMASLVRQWGNQTQTAALA